MTAVSKKNIMMPVSSGPPKKMKPSKKKTGMGGLFGLLSDWKIDTQNLKDELRD